MIKKSLISGFFADVISLLSSRFFILGLDFVSSILITRLLGPESKGIVTVLLIIPNMLRTFADLGLRQAGMYFMGKKISC